MNYLTAPLMDGPSVQPDNALTGGQARRAWINALADRVGEYIPPELRGGVNMLSMLNPVNDVGEAMQNSRVMMDGSRSGRERFDAGVDMATNMAAVLAPVVAGKVAGGADEAADVVDALLGFGGPTREAATDYAKRFAADESGAIKIPNAPYKNLRERYAREIAPDGKNPQRIKLTPARLDSAKERMSPDWFDPSLFASAEEAAKYREFMLRPTSQMKSAREFAEEMVRRGEDVRFKMPDGDRGSLYVRVGDKGTVRFSDHPQPIEAGEVVGGYSSKLGRRHQPATISVDPQSGVSVQDALTAFAPQESSGFLVKGATEGAPPAAILTNPPTEPTRTFKIRGSERAVVPQPTNSLVSRQASTDPATQRGAMTPADEVDAWLNGEGG